VLRPVLLALALGLAFAAAAWTAAPANAAVVSFTGGGLTITGAPGEGSRLTVEADANTRATVHDDADGLQPGPGCIGTPRQVVCEMLLAQGCYPCAATIDLGDASDTLILSGTPVKGPFIVEAGAGDDLVQLVGDANAIVRGGPGNDTLRADGLSELDGGEGADVLQGDRASASYVSRTEAVTVTLDGVANDGVLGEHDNAATGSIIGGDGADALTGNGAGNEISGRAGADFLAGEDGDDTLRAAGGGIDRVEAGAGDDRVEGTIDTDVRCGAGRDVASGLRVPGAYGDCETVFETGGDLPYLTVGAITVIKQRPRVVIGWHDPLTEVGPAVTASGIAEMRYRGRIIARGRFTNVVQPEQRRIGLPLTARGRALACRSARSVRLLVVATGQVPLNTSRAAIRRGARLPRIGRCAERTAKQR
jgi:hypothetical protein